MTVANTQISDTQVALILALQEDHFKDLKSKEIKPAKLSRSVSGFANSVGGELYIGITENDLPSGEKMREWVGFTDQEEANPHIQLFEEIFPLGGYCSYSFLSNPGKTGLVLQVQINKTKEIINSSDGIPYVRRNAQNIPVKTPEGLERLKLDKGIESYEGRTVNIEKSNISDSDIVYEFLIQVVPTSEPEAWLKKQLLIKQELPTVAGVLLFSDIPQVALPKQSGVKLYRYTTKGEATRESLSNLPLSIEGAIYNLIYQSVEEVVSIIEGISVLTKDGMDKAVYPRETLHEIITNAVLHRDYSIPSDIHIRIFDNRLEIESPGKLPGHVTVRNILKEQFARNGAVVRLINKFPNPPNKDVGEGLNTAFDAMKKLRLKAPTIQELENSVLVTIKHEPLASPEDIVLEYLQKHSEINNTTGRELTGIQSENTMKNVFKRLQSRGIIEPVPGKKSAASSWQLTKSAN
ncbi:MAG: ATP-dependent DNA helicase RecG [Sphingobacteriaceae bacterium]|nr:MAG: ATP-dependent DNA helicase RecG [Sphingobacteriaceae bacterium]